MVLQPLQVHLGLVTSFAFSPNSKVVILGSYDKAVRLSDTVIRLALQAFKDYWGSAGSVAFSFNGRVVVLG